MLHQKSQQYLFITILGFVLLTSFQPNLATAQDKIKASSGNFGLPGVIDVPSAKNFPDGEIVFLNNYITP